MADPLRAFPKSPGSTQWVCQNLVKRSEYDVDVEAATCNCKLFEHKRRCKHLDYTLARARLYAGARDEYERLVEGLLKQAA